MDWGVRVTTLSLWMVIAFSAISESEGDQRIVCYYTNWSVYRPGTAKYSPQNINPYLCTHLIYAFGGFTKDNTLKPFDKYQDIEKGGYAKFTGLKTYNKNLKTMLAIGGWNEGSSRFSPMVADPERRRELVKNSVKFLRQNHFDGLDLDWEYPAFRDGGKPRDKNNYADLVQELREEFERESLKTGRPRLLLSMAVPAGIEYLEKGYDLPRLNEYLDFFNLLSYDYHSAFEPAVNHHSPLYGLEEANEYNYDSELTIDYTINFLLNHDVTSEKIVLGIPTYGRSYTLYNTEATDIGAPADGPGEEGDATREKGYLAYYEICENIAKSDEWEVIQPNEKAMGPYAFRENQWVGYDDENIVRVKAFYVKEKKLGGIMFWSIDNDDFRGKCHGRPYPLIEAAKEALLSGSERPSERTKPPAPRKKTRPHSSQRTTDASADRKYSSPRRSGPKPTRKRQSSTRSPPRPTKTPPPDEESQESPESPEERNTLTRPRKTRPKSRTGARRREQTRKIERVAEDAPSLSNSLTTPEPPTTPDPGSDFKCEDEGFFPHPRDCKKYFWCLDSGPSGLGVVAHQFTCPSGLVFNKAADSCDYPRNVVCPKVKTSSGTSTTPKPVTTSRTTKRTTTAKPESEEEEYEYEDEEENIAEDEEVPISTTAKPLLYKTISRSRPTTTTTTTEATTTEGTTETSRGFKGGDGESEDTEDPKVLKDLINLIRKAGGIEQLEKQLHLQEKASGDTTQGSLATPATISRSLYERVLNRQATKLFGGTSGKDTKLVMNSRGSFQNGPGRSQFEGLDEVPEVKSLRRTNKHQYVTIARQRSSTNEPAADEDEEELGEDEGIEQDNDDASSDDREVSNFPEKERNSSPKRVTPNYVNIRRARPTTPANDNDLEEKDTQEENSSKFSRRQHNRNSPSEEEPEDSPSPTGSIQENSQETTTAKTRYTNVSRFRSTTTSSTEAEDALISSEETSPPTTPLELTPTEPQVFSTPSSSPSTEATKPSTESFLDATSPTISTTYQPATEPVKLVENSVTEILLTTFPAQSTPRTTPLPRTTASVVSSPRPFGYPRRTRPTSSSSSSSSTTTTTAPSTTEQSRVKVSNRPTRNFARPSSSLQNRVRTRTRASTVSNDISQSVENNSNEVTSVEPEGQTIGRSRLATRRGGIRFSSRTTTTELPKPTASTPDDISTSRFSSRRRGRLTSTTEATTSSSEIARRRRPTDSKIIRITSDNSELLKQSRSEFIGNSEDDEKITKIRVFKVKEDVSNIIEPSGFENETIKLTEPFDPITEISTSGDPVSASTLLTTTEVSTTVTEPIDTHFTTTTTTESIATTLDDTNLDNSTVDNEQSGEEDKKSLKRKVLLRRRPVTPSTSTEETTIEVKRRRKILRRVRPHLEDVSNELPTTEDPEIIFSGISPTPSMFALEEKEESTESSTEPSVNEITTDLIDKMTTIFDNSGKTTVDSTTIVTGSDDVTTIAVETTAETERPSDDDNLLETAIRTTKIDVEEPTTISTTVSTTPVSTTASDPVSRFVRRKFVRKRPAFSSTTPTPAPTSARRFGVSKSSGRLTPEPAISAINSRRRGLFVRRRPVPSTTAGVNEDTDVNEDLQRFWSHQATPATTIGLTPIDDSEVSSTLISKEPDSSPEESSDKLGNAVGFRSGRTRFIGENEAESTDTDEVDDEQIFKFPIANSHRVNAPKKQSNVPVGFWQSQLPKTRSYPRKPTTTESSVTETLIPARKFDYVADALLRKQQSQKPPSNTPPTPKQSVTRLVTSVVESGTTERQIILIKTKYSSLTSATKIPYDNSLHYDKDYPSSEEQRYFLLNEIHEPTERAVEKSTLPIERVFARRARYFVTEPSVESSTIEIESVFNDLVNLEIPDKPDLPTLKQLIDTNYGITRSFGTSANSTQAYDVQSLNDEIDNKLPQIINSDGIKVRVKILDDYGSGEVKINQFAVLSLPHGAINPNITSTILKIEVINDSKVGQSLSDEAELLDNRLSRGTRGEDKNVANGSSQRISRRRGRVDHQSTTPESTTGRRRNVRRRGNSRITYVDQNAQNTEIVNNTSTSSMNDQLMTTVKPTTLRGSSVVIHSSDEPVRGFFITKSLEDVWSVTEAINLKELTTEIPSTTSSDVILTTIDRGSEISTQFTTTEDSEISSNELDSETIPTTQEGTATQVFEYLTTPRPVETTLIQETIEDHEVSNPQITTYHPTKVPEAAELEIDTENDVNNGEGGNIETTTFREEKSTTNFVDDSTIHDRLLEKLNESNVVTGESGSEYTTTENNYEAMVFTTPSSFTAVHAEFNESEEISTGVEVTTAKINDERTTTAEEVTTEAAKSVPSVVDEVIDTINKNRTTIILQIIPFTQEDEQTPSTPLDWQTPTSEAPRVTPLTPEEAENAIPTDASPGKSSSVPVISPTTPVSSSPANPTSATPSTTSELPPEVSSRRTRPNGRSRGRVRYQQSSPSTSAPRDRKPRPFPNRRRPQSPPGQPELPESSEESTVITTSSPPSPPTRARTPLRGRGRGRTRQTTTTTTEPTSPLTEEPEIHSKNEENNPNSQATLQNPQTEATNDDDQAIAESSHAEVLGEVGVLRHPGNFLRRPGSIGRPTTSKSYAIEYETAGRRYSSKFIVPTTANSDQTGRAQEIAESLIDPSVAASFETGRETSTNRGPQRHRLEEFKGITETPITRTTSPRRRQRPTTGPQEAKVVPNRPRRPAIIDYDYYVDEEVRISVKPELKNKIYVTASGRIGCLDQGTFAHPFSCKKFITCAKMVAGQVVPTEYSCPNKLSFDPVGGICNWSAGLGCKESL